MISKDSLIEEETVLHLRSWSSSNDRMPPFPQCLPHQSCPRPWPHASELYYYNGRKFWSNVEQRDRGLNNWHNQDRQQQRLVEWVRANPWLQRNIKRKKRHRTVHVYFKRSVQFLNELKPAQGRLVDNTHSYRNMHNVNKLTRTLLCIFESFNW